MSCATSHYVANPGVPYTGRIEPADMSCGKTIYISGYIPSGADKFEVNLYTGPGEPNDIAMHFNPRFSTQQCVRNHRIDGEWGDSDDEHTDGPFPFEDAANFEMKILCTDEGYKISVGGEECFDFGFRLAREMVTHINVSGDVELHGIKQEGGLVKRLTNPPVPVVMPVEGGMCAGRCVTIEGSPCHDANRFSFNLVKGSNVDGGDIPLHFDVRVDYGEQNVVVRNTQEGGGWGDEERCDGFPFERERPFSVQFLCQDDGYRIMVDGNEFCFYAHRAQPSCCADHVEISGDVHVSNIEWC